jgi:DNA-directed RNA polymerase specialized sigma24 family protein
MEFCSQYWQPIYQVARRAGLSVAEAEDVVVELVVMAAPHLVDFQPWASRGLRTWVRETTKWRIQHRLSSGHLAGPAQPDALELETAWEEEWQLGLFQIALANVKQQAPPEFYQVYDLWILRRWPLAKVRSSLGMKLLQALLAGLRVKRMVERERRRLQD